MQRLASTHLNFWMQSKKSTPFKRKSVKFTSQTTCSNRKNKTLFEKMRKVTQDSNILPMVQGYNIPFLERSFQKVLPTTPYKPKSESREENFNQIRISRNVRMVKFVKMLFIKCKRDFCQIQFQKRCGILIGTEFEIFGTFHTLETVQNGGSRNYA